MGKLFGTDGVRGVVNKDLTSFLAHRIGVSVSKVMKENMNKDNLTFLIGSDTRLSKDMLTASVSSGVMSEGCNIIDVGVMPTPAIAYLVKKYKLDGAFVISASHNPSEYNGIKVLDSEGYKISDDIEFKCEDIILNNFQRNTKINDCGTYKKIDAKKDYIDYLVSTVKNDLSNYKVLVDTANGATYITAKDLFDRLNIKADFINCKPNGLNINEDSGSTHISGLLDIMGTGIYDIGIAYDGDADRVILVDEKGNIIDGDFVLAIIGNYLKKHNILNNNTIVGTVMSNLGLVKFCDENSIDFVKTKVGDKYVLESMIENDYVIGGEQSGHTILKNYANTGDGELTSIQILDIMKEERKTLGELSKVMKKYPQVLINAVVSKEKKDEYKNNLNIQNKIKEYEKILSDDGRVLVRPSGTENLIRVMIEGKDEDLITNMCEDLVLLIEKELSNDKIKIKTKRT